MVRVATAAALKRAIDSGAPHVHIVEHLNLDPILPKDFTWKYFNDTGLSALRSLTVRFFAQ